MSILKTNNIFFRYPTKSKNNNFSLNNINLKIFKGEFVCILGPNGSGKSTFIKLLANVLTPTQGEIYLEDKLYRTIKIKDFAKKVSFVPQIEKIIFPYSVYEIVMMGRYPFLNLMGLENDIDHQIVISTLELLEIKHLMHHGINEISGGEAQRALIARALVQKPEILLLDEPNAHLDIKHQLAIFSLLNSLNKNNNLTVIAISHDLNLAMQFGSRALLMNNGNIVFDSIPQNVLTSENIKDIFKVNSFLVQNLKEDKPLIALDYLIKNKK